MTPISTIFLAPMLILKIASVNAQIAKDDTRPIDSHFAYSHIVAPVIHNYNVNPTPNGPVMPCYHANGLYNGNPNQTIAWSNTDDVPASLASQINSINGMSYKTFDLGLFTNLQAYEDSVSNWLIGSGLPVGINGTKNSEAIFFLNPVRGYSIPRANIKSGLEFKIVLTDLSGRELERYDGTTGINGLDISINFEGYKPGTYLLRWITEGTSEIQKIVVSRDVVK